MAIPIQLDDVRRAWESEDPDLANLVVLLTGQPDEPPKVPIREGAPTFARFLEEIRSKSFRRKPFEEQAHLRRERLKSLEAADAEVPLADRLRLHEIIGALWEDNGPYARSVLLEIIARVQLRYGPWRALKRILKESEARGDTEIFGALAARIDTALSTAHDEVGRSTIAYLARRAWRFLRQSASILPAAYPDLAVDVLAHYTDATNWNATWVANHIFFHDSRKYNRTLFFNEAFRGDLLKNRAFADLWKRSPRPLFALLERARSDRVREFATSALKQDFRAALREVEPAWVARLVGVGSRAIDEFVIWLLANVPKFERGAFRTLGLHEAVLRLFNSPAPDARAYASEYARAHARDLPVPDLIRLANNDHQNVRRLASDLLLERDPRRDVGLEAWGQLLESPRGHTLAADVLRKHFGASELTPDWFRDRLATTSREAFNFIKDRLPQIHPPAKLGPGFFIEIINRLDDPGRRLASDVAEFALGELARFELNALDRDFLRRLMIHPLTREDAADWIDEGRLKPQTLGADFFKSLAFHPDWESDAWIADLQQSGRTWARQLSFNEATADKVLGWLREVRRFTAADLGFDWLSKLVARSEPRYHDFAVEVMIKGFNPADFAPKDNAAPIATAEKAPVDLTGASFLFTGKMATMDRKTAEGQVRQAGGAVASGVTAKLHYLVIGDEGSPLYGHGKKGTKQLKGEELNASGANIKIISETAFLKMLAGEPQSYSADAALAGSERLWQMATAPGAADQPRARFALKYLRRHHPDIALAETDRPVDPGAEIPPEFLSFERIKPLFNETRKPLRDFALELARWEFARWSPPSEDLLWLAEVPHSDVRQFVADALLADDAPEHRRYRIDPERLTPAAVYSFCESADESTRALGMQLIRRSPRLRLPEELFRLTESPDRRVRAFVIRELWTLYRDRGITDGWKPTAPALPTVGSAAKKAAAKEIERLGEGPPGRPEQPPAGPRDLTGFLRRILFEIPPARLETVEGPEIKDRVKPLPARKAKLALIEVLRDLAIEEVAFGRGVLPLLREFMTTRGKSEHDACLVALTRIQHVHPELRRNGIEAAS